MKNNAQKQETFVQEEADKGEGTLADKGTFDTKIAQKNYSKTNNIEYIPPKKNLAKKVKPLPAGSPDPIKAAERQTKQIMAGSKIWLKQDLKNLMSAYRVFSKDTENEENFQLLNHQVHNIKGNAPILGAVSAGMIANPLSTMLEGCSDHKSAKPIISLAITAIYRAMEFSIPKDDAELLELIEQLNLVNNNCKLQKAQNKKPQIGPDANNQAAGSDNRSFATNCSSKGNCSSGGVCLDTCAKSGLVGK